MALDFLLFEAVEGEALSWWVGEPEGCPVDIFEGELEGCSVGISEELIVGAVEGADLGR